MAGQRDIVNRPHPMYDLPGFGIDALPKSYATAREVVAAQSNDFTSDAIAHGTNGFEVLGTFAAGATEATVSILDADDSDRVLATYLLTPGVVKYFTFYDVRIQISAHPNVKFKIEDIDDGTVAVNIRATA